MTISPASAMRRASSPTRRTFSVRVAASKPRSAFKPCRRLSPSSSMVWQPAAASLRSRRLAIVDSPAPGKPVSHTTKGLLGLGGGALGRRDVLGLMMEVRRLVQPRNHHAGGNGRQGGPVDQDERAGLSILGIRIEGDKLRSLDPGTTDRVQLQLFARCALQGVDIQCINRLMVAGTVAVPVLSRKWPPDNAGVSTIQTRSAANQRLKVGLSVGSASTSPRMISRSSTKVRVTERPRLPRRPSPGSAYIADGRVRRGRQRRAWTSRRNGRRRRW